MKYESGRMEKAYQEWLARFAGVVPFDEDDPQGREAYREAYEAGLHQAKLDEIGVEGSIPRRILDLMESLGLSFVEALGTDHPSRVSLRFDADECWTTITYEDTEKGKGE